MTVLIVGLGSIAQKHIRVLKDIENDINLIALRSGGSKNAYKSVTNIYSIEELNVKPDFAIISNPTSEHYTSIELLLQLQIPLFIEKPVLMSLEGAGELLRKIEVLNIKTYIACNLRFHPCIQYLKKTLSRKRLYEANIYCGSYLPEWRTDRDYRNTYSAKTEMGGGVHLDLIHEVDYSYWLWGKPRNIETSFRKISKLEINSVDYAHYVMEYPDKNIHITLNYFRKQAKRNLELVFQDDIWEVNLLENEIYSAKDNNIIFSSNRTMVGTYKFQMNYFLDLLKGQKKIMNDFRESLQVLKICLNEYS